MGRTAESNYEITRNAMEKKFLEYDQQDMIEKFRLKYDLQYLYIQLAGREYRIHRLTGRTEYFSGKEQAYLHGDFNAVMTIFDILCYSRPEAALAGKFVSLNHLKGLTVASAPGPDMFAREAEAWNGKCGKLQTACERLAGTPEKIGDVSYKILLFPFLPVILQFWEGDEEFAPVLKLLWDENILDYMHFETTFYATSYLLERLREETADLEKQTGK